MTTGSDKQDGNDIKLEIFLGKRLRFFRKKSRWSLMELGKLVGVSHHQIHKYELAQTRISSAKLFKFTQLFSVDADQFFEGFQG